LISSKGPASGGWLLLLIPGLIWGASFLFIAEGLSAVGPYGIAFLRILIGFVTLALFPAARKPIDRADWPTIAALGVVWFAFPLTMFPLAEQRVSSAMTGMLNGANPLFTVIVAALIARRAPTVSVLVSLAIGMAGTVLIAIPAVGEGQSSIIGIVMIMSALLSYGVALNVARPLQQKYGGTPVIWRGQMVGLLLTAPLGMDRAGCAGDWRRLCADGHRGGPVRSRASVWHDVSDSGRCAGTGCDAAQRTRANDLSDRLSGLPHRRLADEARIQPLIRPPTRPP